ncbi:DUF4253 domain-containing protein [Streptomyces glaucosporus]|uniref:DUF4253 domain-containing protein n=1 Tax=Streptomyces glaucosporus TaxID=284044 RepID=A0ABP5VFH8_9ACTN
MSGARGLRSLAGSADLPPGALVDRTVLGGRSEPLLWRADAPAGPGDWGRMLRVARSAGLWPVLLGRNGRGTSPEDDLLPEPVPAGVGAAGTLARWWEEHAAREPDGTALRPYGGRWPGLAPPPGGAVGDPGAAAEAVARSLVSSGTLRDPRIALVPARRGADVPAAIGWTGTLASGEGPAPFGAVLRSWEERFGARVVALEPDVLHLSVAAPPRTAREALAVAAEHFAFCPAVVRQGPGSLARYAEKWLLPGRGHWSFWWD